MPLLAAMVFFVALGYAAGLPLLRFYLSRYLAGDAGATVTSWHVGMVGATYTFALFLFAPLWGRLSDENGRTVVLAAGFAAFLVGGAMTGLAPNLAFVYLARFLAGAGAAAIIPTAQAYIADVSTSAERSRRFVVLGTASFAGLLAGPAFGTWVAGPIMGMQLPSMPAMVNWPALAVAGAGLPLLLLAPWCMGRSGGSRHRKIEAPASTVRRRFVASSMALAVLASFAVGTFEVGFNLFGGQTLGLPTGTMALMFVTCSLAMFAAQSALMLSSVRKRLDQRWLAVAFVAAALALTFTSAVPDGAALGLLIAVVSSGIGLITPVLSYELLERHSGARGALLGRQASAGNLGQAIGSMVAGSAFGWQPLAPFWMAAVVLVAGAALALRWWGPARDGEIAAQRHGRARPG